MQAVQGWYLALVSCTKSDSWTSCKDGWAAKRLPGCIVSWPVEDTAIVKGQAKHILGCLSHPLCKRWVREGWPELHTECIVASLWACVCVHAQLLIDAKLIATIFIVLIRGSRCIANKYGDGSQIGGCYKKKQSALQHLLSAVEVSLWSAVALNIMQPMQCLIFPLIEASKFPTN